MLRRFPIESKGRRKKLREVCSLSFNGVLESPCSLFGPYFLSIYIWVYCCLFNAVTYAVHFFLPTTLLLFSGSQYSCFQWFITFCLYISDFETRCLKYLPITVQVGCVTAICFTCFTIRSFIVSFGVIHSRLH